MDPKDISFSVDLVEAALRHMNFLDQVSAIQDTLLGSALKHAYRRYEQLWLPLADENRSHAVVAPIDIEWFWYIHMLSPLAYRRDCRKLLSKTLSHEFPSQDQTVSRTNTAIELWYAKFKLDGFNIIRNGEYTRPVRNKGELQDIPSKLSVDLILNSQHHIHFCYQVALPHFRDKKYLESAVQRYKQFLCLKRDEPDEFLTPSVDIMLIWFTHMCHPKAYARDLLGNIGQVLANNVKVRPTLVTEQFLTARKKTNALWQRMASTNLMQPGSKLRSNLNTRPISSMTMEDLVSCCDMIYRVHINHAQLTSRPRRVRKFQVNLVLAGNEANEANVLETLEGPRRMWSLSTSFHFNSSEHTCLVAQLSRSSRMWCIRSDHSVGSGSFDMRTYLKEAGLEGKPLSIEIDMQDELKLILEGSVPTAIPDLCNLVLQRGDFEQQTLGIQELRRILGSISVPGQVVSREQTCFVSISSLLNQQEVECFRCRVIHIPNMLCSGIQVFYGTKLVATSDVIGSSHLPTATQLEWTDTSMAFDPELGERAMLIRNSKGDWGLCVARWIQDKPPGFLEVRFMKLTGTKKIVSLELTSVELEFQSFTTNMYSGEIFINPGSNTVGENLALIWTISVLYVLCAPNKLHRELSFTTPMKEIFSSKADLTAEEEKGGETNPIYVEEANCQILLAAGLATQVPSNAYILSKFGSLKYDINLDTQDMVVEEQVLDKKLFRKESKELRGDFVDSPGKSKKKRKLKFNESLGDCGVTDSSMLSERTDKEISPVKGKPKTNQVAPLNDQNSGDNELESQKGVSKKRKRIRKKKSSALDEMLPMSDDSISKEDVEVKKLVKDKQGKTIAVKKISNLNEELVPSDDSVDQEEKELNEFLHDITKMEGTEGKEALELGNIEMVREETTMIRDIADQRKHNNSESESTDTRIATEALLPVHDKTTEKEQAESEQGNENDQDTLADNKECETEGISINNTHGDNNIENTETNMVEQGDNSDHQNRHVTFYLSKDKNAIPTPVET